MAKALVGYLGVTDRRVEARLASENRRLRQRVADLEEHVLRLQVENDRLLSSVDEDTLLRLGEQMQPA